MKDDIIKTTMAIILAIVAGVLVWVCDTFTVPSIAVTITLILCGIAGWALYRICKIWVLRLYKRLNKKIKNN
jgi:hypothetical protein